MENDKSDDARLHPATKERLPKSRRDYTLTTPMMRDLKDIVLSAVQNLETGMTVFCRSRIGKTRALDYLHVQLRIDAPEVHIERVVMISKFHLRDNAFFFHLMNYGRDGDRFNRDIDYRKRFTRGLVSRCAESGSSQLLLIIDEAQRLTNAHYSYLIDLTNELEDLGVDPTVLLIGQKELLSIIDELNSADRQDALGRFFDILIEFEPVNNLNVLREILQQYDDPAKCNFPIGSDICLTAAYLAEFYKHKNFRIERHASSLWQAITAISKKFGYQPQIGMKHLTKTIETALERILVSGEVDDANNENWWADILLSTGYARSLNHGIRSVS